MPAEYLDLVDELLGLSHSAADLEFRHMVWRTLLVFIVAVLLARLGARRFLAHNAGFDIMVAIVLGSVLSRGINGEAAFFPSLGAAIFLVVLHHCLASLTFRSHWFSMLVKGRPQVLVKNGEMNRHAMAQTKITADDLDENLRLNGGVREMRDVAEARLERNGTVSVVKAKPAEQ